MIKALFGNTTTPWLLRRGLDTSMAEHQRIARKVAAAVTQSDEASGGADGGAAGAQGAADLSQDMASLADTQMRYEAEARLLQLVYQNLRSSFRSNG